MTRKEVNITSLQKNLPELLETVIQGDEIILTKHNIPIAKISPIEDSSISLKSNFLTARAIEAKRIRHTDASENWFG